MEQQTFIIMNYLRNTDPDTQLRQITYPSERVIKITLAN